MARLSSLRHSCQHLYQHPKNIGVWGGFDTILKFIASNSVLRLQTVTSSEGLPVLKVSPLGANKVNILPKPILHDVNQSFFQHYMKWNNYWDSFLVNGIIPFLVLAVCNARLVNNKTKYFRLRKYDSQLKRPTSAPDNFVLVRTDRVTPWTPVRAKNHRVKVRKRCSHNDTQTEWDAAFQSS